MSFLKPGLTAQAASHICRHECRAMCCRGPAYLRLTPDEALRFEADARALGVVATVRRDDAGNGLVCFPDHEGDRCPMLDATTFMCRIYASRPARCRAFPDRPREGCAISR